MSEVLQTENISDSVNCPQCSFACEPSAYYCPHCGKRINTDENVKGGFSNYITPFLIYYGISMLLVIIMDFGNISDDSLFRVSIFDILFTLLTIGFALFSFRQMIRLYSFRGFRWGIVAWVAPAAFLFGIAIIYPVDEINKSLFGTTMEYLPAYQDAAYPRLMLILSLCLQPAIIEEMAFRGFLWNYARKFLTPQSTLIVISLLFALLHLSLISFLWLFPVALLLGYLRHKTNIIWYSMIAHFMYNLGGIFLELFQVF